MILKGLDSVQKRKRIQKAYGAHYRSLRFRIYHSWRQYTNERKEIYAFQRTAIAEWNIEITQTCLLEWTIKTSRCHAASNLFTIVRIRIQRHNLNRWRSLVQIKREMLNLSNRLRDKWIAAMTINWR